MFTSIVMHFTCLSFQDDWRTSIIFPIYKSKGKEKSDHSSYHPILLILVISKLFEKNVSSIKLQGF